MIGIVLDSVLMLLLVAAVGYGVRLEKKLTALRAGQLAFAGAVNELNTAVGLAQSALSDLRVAGEDADLLHDRIVKARTLKGELETLMSRMERAGRTPSGLNVEGRTREDDVSEQSVVRPTPTIARAAPVMETVEDDRARRMQALADRIQGMAAPREAAPGHDNVSAILGALNSGRTTSARPSVRGANQTVQDSINRARRSLDDDLFAA